MKKCFFPLAALISAGCGWTASGAASLGPRHVYIMETLQDPEQGRALRVTYLFGVVPDQEQPALESTVYPMIPRTVDEFRVMEGAEQSQFQTAADGRILMRGQFGAGSAGTEAGGGGQQQSMVAVGLLFRSDSRALELPFDAPAGVDSLELLWNDPHLDVEAPLLGEREVVAIGDKSYFKRTWKISELPLAASEAGEAGGPGVRAARLLVIGMPEGREPYWIAGLAVAGVLLLAGIALTLATKPAGKAEPVLDA